MHTCTGLRARWHGARVVVFVGLLSFGWADLSGAQPAATPTPPASATAPAAPPAGAGAPDLAQLLQQHCASADPPWPDGTAWAADQARLRRLLQRADPESLALACRLAMAAAHRAADDPLAVDAAAVPVLEALALAGRHVEVLAHGPHLHARLAAAGAVHEVTAARLAGVLSEVHDQRDELQSALAWSNQQQAVMAARPEAFDPPSYWAGRHNHALRLIDARQYAQAEALLQAMVASVAGQTELVRWHALALGSLGGLLSRQQRFPEATRFFQADLDLRLAQLPEDRIGLATAYQNLAVQRQRAAQLDEAEALFGRALALFQPGELDRHGIHILVWDSLSGLLVARGKGEPALAAARSAVELVAQSPMANTPRAAGPWFRLANAQKHLGRWGDAVVSLRRALALLGSSGQRANQALTVNAMLTLATAQLELDDLQGAEATLAQAAEAIARAGSIRSQVALYQMRRSRLAEALDRPQEALAALVEAQGLIGQIYPPTHHLPRNLIGQRCRLDPAQCAPLEDLMQAAPQHTGVPLTPEVEAGNSLTLARHALSRGDAASATNWALRALLASQAGSLPDLQWQAYESLAAGLHAQGQGEAAMACAKRAVNIIQAMRQGLQPLGAAADAGYLRRKSSVYRRLAEWLMQTDRLGEALEVLQAMKSGEQHDFRARATALPGQPLSLTSAEQAMLSRLDAHLAARQDPAEQAQQSRARQLLGASRLSAAERDELNQWLQARAARSADEIEALRALLASLHHEAGDARASAGRPRGRALQAMIQPPNRPRDRRAMHAYLVLGEDRLTVLTLGPRRHALWRQPVDARQLNQDIAAFIDTIAQRGASLPQAQALYRQVALPIAQAARRQGATRITLWLDGALRYLPFEALHDGHRYWAEVYQTVRAPVHALPGGQAGAQAGQAVSVGPLMAAPPPPPPAATLRVSAFGLSQAVGSFAALPGVAEEVCGIVGGLVWGLPGPTPGCAQAGPPGIGTGPFRGQADLNGFFTAQQLRAVTGANARNRTPSLLHIGTHFVLRPGHVSRSWLLLGDGQRLGLDQMQDLALGHTELVTLSACEAGAPGMGAEGVEVDGLPASLIGQGARRVLASLWKVEDRHTAAFMRRFYAELAARPGDYRDALQAVQRASLRGWPGLSPQPRHWAAFTLVEAAP